MAEEKKTHEGHRQRMRKRVEQQGFDSLEPHEALEYLLYITNARKDTNQLAHDLMGRFGDFAGVLEATEEDLLTVEGVGPATARMLHLLPAVSRYYTQCRTNGKICIKTTEQLEVYLLRLFAGQAARHGGGELLQIKVSVGGRIQTVTALHDTGNTLRDPVTGSPVLVLERRSADALWTLAVADVLAEQLSPEEKMAKLHRIGCPVRFTVLPFRAVGTAAGLLLAACSDYIEVNGKRYPRTPVALSEQAVSDGGGYHALWGAMEGRIGHGKASDLAETPVAQRIQAG